MGNGENRIDIDTHYRKNKSKQTDKHTNRENRV